MDNPLEKKEAAMNAKKEEIEELGEQMPRPLTVEEADNLAGGGGEDPVERMCPRCGNVNTIYKSYPVGGKNNPGLRQFVLKCERCDYQASWID